MYSWRFHQCEFHGPTFLLLPIDEYQAGQICMSTDRILVHESVSKDFLEVMKSSLAQAATNGSALPVMATSASKARLQKSISEAMSKGASVLSGSDQPDAVPGASIIPTVLKDVDTSTTIWNEENFGPIVAITTVTSDEEAVKIANSSEYGLSAAVFTTDLRRGLAIAKQLESGYITLFHLHFLIVWAS
jgi:acyl-CoA reductase-like NAD-dependent aldehyde dehydrogenase